MFDVRNSGLNWTTINGNDYYREIPIHVCNDTDRANLFTPNTNFISEIDTLFDSLYCFDSLDDLKLYGNFNTDNC